LEIGYLTAESSDKPKEGRTKTDAIAVIDQEAVKESVVFRDQNRITELIFWKMQILGIS
jgi:hypothetical protein